MTVRYRTILAGTGLCAALGMGLYAVPASGAPRDGASAARATSQDVSAIRNRRDRVRHAGRVYRDRHRFPAGVAGAVVGLATAPFWLFGGYPYYGGGYEAGPYEGGYAVAPVVRTPGRSYYAYNRYSGQIYGSCVIDLGYGRTQPCDAGGAP